MFLSTNKINAPSFVRPKSFKWFYTAIFVFFTMNMFRCRKKERRYDSWENVDWDWPFSVRKNGCSTSPSTCLVQSYFWLSVILSVFQLKLFLRLLKEILLKKPLLLEEAIVQKLEFSLNKQKSH